MTTFLRSPAAFFFRWKWIAALALATLADWLFFEQPAGWTLGLFTAAVLAVFLCFNLRVLKQTAGILCALLLLGLALIGMEAPNWLSGLLTLAGFATMALLCFGKFPGDAIAWLRQAGVYLASGWLRPFRDARSLARWKKKYPHRCGFNAQWLVPLVFAGLFVSLFAGANPLIQQWLEWLDWDLICEILKPSRLFYLGFMFFTLWAFLRPYRWFRLHRGVEWVAHRMPGWQWYLTDKSVLQGSLVMFNALFLLQTGMDAMYLWGGVSLPEGMTYAEYAHRGAYPLIFTALLAGVFVLVSFRPGSETSRSPAIRWLVGLWIMQNVFLTVSSILRTLLYIEVYSLTHWRVAAIIWMGLVGLGLLLVLWRILKDRSSRWLMNANALALLVVLYGCSVLDFDGMIAWYNVQHCKEVTGQGQPLDIYYLESHSGVEALPALAWFRRHADPGSFRIQDAADIERRLTAVLASGQSAWRGWTWRNHRLLQQAESARRDAQAQGPENSARPPVASGAGTE